MQQRVQYLSTHMSLDNIQLTLDLVTLWSLNSSTPLTFYIHQRIQTKKDKQI